jgi:hypothetical protein
MEEYALGLREASTEELFGQIGIWRGSYHSTIFSCGKNFSVATEARSLVPKEISRPKPVYTEEGKMKILTKEMEEEIFYLVSYKGEKYAIRKLDENRVEFREVEE